MSVPHCVDWEPNLGRVIILVSSKYTNIHLDTYIYIYIHIYTGFVSCLCFLICIYYICFARWDDWEPILCRATPLISSTYIYIYIYIYIKFFIYIYVCVTSRYIYVYIRISMFLYVYLLYVFLVRTIRNRVWVRYSCCFLLYMKINNIYIFI